jgi:hypothetical protein
MVTLSLFLMCWLGYSLLAALIENWSWSRGKDEPRLPYNVGTKQ